MRNFENKRERTVNGSLSVYYLIAKKYIKYIMNERVYKVYKGQRSI